METFGQIVGIIFAVLLLFLAYLLYSKDKFPSAVMVAWASVFILLCSFPWFQGWAKSFFSSQIISKLNDLGKQVTTVQETTTAMLINLSNQVNTVKATTEEMHKRLDNHQKQLDEFQITIRGEQTNLDAQAKQLADVEYWVKNRFLDVFNG